MRLLVTGGTGFLGKQVNLLLSAHPEIKIINVVRRKPSSYNEVLWDFCTPLPDSISFDAVLHMASAITYQKYSNVLQENIVPAIHIFNAARRNNAKIFFTSTASIHGSHQIWSIDEEIEPTDDYALSKLLCEHIFQSLPMNVCIFRLNGVYGFQKSTHLGVNNAIYQALIYKQKPLLKGDGNGLRNYISVTDAAKWIVYEILQQESGSKIIYMAGSESLSIKHWLETIAKKILGDGSLERHPGNAIKDVLVTASPCPFERQSLAEYLDNLCNKHENLFFF